MSRPLGLPRSRRELPASVEGATVIAAHEEIWSLADLLISAGALAAPTAAEIEDRLFARIDR